MRYELDFTSIDAASLHALLGGMGVSVRITMTAIFVGVAFGTVLTLMRLSHIRPVSWISTAYVTLFRSLPLVVVLLWFFLVVPQLLQATLQIETSTDLRMASALVAFSLFEAAYFSEIVRSGLKSVGGGQLAAATALGLNWQQAYLHVMLPQAFRNMRPLLLTQSIVLFQDTSLVYVSALADFFGRATLIGERDGRIVELLLFAGAVYFCICSSVSLGARWFFKQGSKVD